METENEDFRVESDYDILTKIKLNPELLKTDAYFQDRYDKIIKLLQKCDDKQYYKLSDTEIIKLVSWKGSELKNLYVQKRILKILNSYTLQKIV